VVAAAWAASARTSRPVSPKSGRTIAILDLDQGAIAAFLFMLRA
jgi:hypothetical protein